MKKFLLIAGDSYYPQAGACDWQECYETYEEAVASFTENPDETFTVNGRKHDWMQIIDLEEWING